MDVRSSGRPKPPLYTLLSAAVSQPRGLKPPRYMSPSVPQGLKPPLYVSTPA